MTMPIWSSRIGTSNIWQNQGSGALRCMHLPKPANAHSKCVCFTTGIFTLKTKHWTQFNDTLVQVFKGKCKDVSALFSEIHQKTMGRVSGLTVWRTFAVSQWETLWGRRTERCAQARSCQHCLQMRKEKAHWQKKEKQVVVYSTVEHHSLLVSEA